MSLAPHHFTVGAIRCAVITDGEQVVDMARATRMFGSVDQAKLEAAYERHTPQPGKGSLSALLIETGGQHLLADTGHGDPAPPGSGLLLDHLRAAGVGPEDIDRVIITHCHGDHINGLVDADGNLTFPNADYVMQRDEWNHWMDADRLAAMDEARAANLRAKLGPIEPRLTLIGYDEAIAPGVRAVAAPGHTPGHMALLVESEGERLLDLVDTIHLLLQCENPDWSPVFDSDQTVAAISRQRLLKLAAEGNILCMMYHFPYPGLGHFKQAGSGYTWQPV
jgi:glyoxylase-like metal-dependent hydrolase (beta-lactamase superfamily II)